MFPPTEQKLILTEFNVVAFKVEDLGSAEDGHVLDLGLSDGWAVVGDEHEFGLAVSHVSHCELVTYMGKGRVSGDGAGGTYQSCTCQI